MQANTSADQLTVHATDKPWLAHHPLEHLASCGQLSLDETPLWTGSTCELGKLQDHLALVQDVRTGLRGGMAGITSKGYLPFGSQPSFTHASRYSDGILRVTTDLHLPRQTTLRHHASVGNLELSATWEAACTLTLDNGNAVLSDWHEIRPLSWESPPLALLLRNAAGTVLEIGTGSDIWRWQQGLSEAGQTGLYSLEPSPSGWRYSRKVTCLEEPLTPVHMQYRFNWYAAWTRQSDARILPQTCHQPAWRDDGKLDVGKLADLDQADWLLIDLADTPWPEALQRTSDGNPCLASRGVANRLRGITRQLEAHPNQAFGICFRHLTPAPCLNGSHLGRSGDVLHWDMGHLLELCPWIRQTLGPQRRLALDPGDLPLPSLRNALHPTTLAIEDPRADSLAF